MILGKTFAVVALGAGVAQVVAWPTFGDAAAAGQIPLKRYAGVRFCANANTALTYIKFDGSVASATNFDIVLPIGAAGTTYDCDVAVPAGSPSISMISAATASVIVSGAGLRG